jgi:adenylate cyclase
MPTLLSPSNSLEIPYLRLYPILLHPARAPSLQHGYGKSAPIRAVLHYPTPARPLFKPHRGRELRLSNMAMEKVPQSVRYSTTLHRLGLSSNRIGGLDEAYLEDLQAFTLPHVQNNRTEKLPWHFSCLRALSTLNISNNKFRVFPPVATQLEAIRDLSVSFNMGLELPEEPGRLVGLERLIIVGNQVTRFSDEWRALHSLRVLDCRRNNNILGLNVVSMLPKLHMLAADHNAAHALHLSLGPCLTTLDASHNEITQLSILGSGPIGTLFALTSLDISHAKLSCTRPALVAACA